MATEAIPDHPGLREARRRRLFEAMAAHDLDALVLGRVANIRYATGVPILWNAGSRPFGPGCVVVRSTEELFLLSTWDEGVPDEIPHDHLFGITWNPMNYVELLKGVAAKASPRRVATDAMSPLFSQLLPMALGDAEIVDAGAALRSARRLKSAEEVEAIAAAIDVAEAGLAGAVAELRPGATARELTAAFMDAMAARGVTTPATQDVVRVTSAGGRRRGPERRIEAGDLVSFDAGVVAGGYVGEVGRTWPAVPDGVPAGTPELYRRWDRLWTALLDACHPGAAASALLDAYRASGEPLPSTPIARGLGLGFDDPVVARGLPATAGSEQLDPGVVLVFTATVSDPTVGTLTTHDPVLITADGPEVLSSSPFWTAERAGADA